MKSAKARPAAVLWDLDGTLVDSEPVWRAEKVKLLGEIGVPWDDELSIAMTGIALEASGRILAAHAGTGHTPEWFVDNMVARVAHELRSNELQWCPGAYDLLAELRVAGVPCALVTASYRDVVDAVISRVPDGSFDVVVVGEEVSKGKPDPEPYLLACERLGVDPVQTIAIEDSIPGSTSANAAGCLVVGLARSVELPPAQRRVLVPDLSGIRLAELERFWLEAHDVG